MTLQQWCDGMGKSVYVRQPYSGGLYIVWPESLSCDRTQEEDNAKWALYHLTDYVVSSVCGVVYWLVPCTIRADSPLITAD